VTLLLVRHGESEGNALGVVQGWQPHPLTPFGHEQAAATAVRLAALEVATVYSSPLARARQTAEAIAATQGLEVADLPDLREYCFGEAEGLRWDEARVRFGLDGRSWGAGEIPGEEGMEAFRARIGAQVAALAERHSEDLAVAVVHGGVLGAVVATVCELPLGVYAQIHTANCGITTVTFREGRVAIEVLNDVCHLRDLGTVPKEPWL
jgi:broad specificity phosphatase PhoE